MYEEKTYKVEWKSVLLKIAFVVLLILIILWLFPNNRFNKGGNTSSTEISKSDYNANYIENITAMKEAALNYYTVNRLPKEIGESSTLTLQEMMNNKLVISFLDAEGNSCDTKNSFVKVTKMEDTEYQLKVSLTCEKQDDYIKATIGCYDVCPDNNNCTYEKNELADTKIQYQLKRTVATANTANKKNYYCDEGYELSGNTCRKLLSGRVYGATWVNGTAGETYNAMIKEETDVKDASYSCPSGYTYNNGTCTKGDVSTIPATVSCPSGYNLSGNTCVKQDTQTIAATFNCPSGYTRNGSSCYKNQTETINATYSCPSGYTASGSSCYKLVQQTTTPTYSCPSGYTRNGNYCTRRTTTAATLSSSWTYVKTIKVKSPLSEYPNSTTRNVLVSQGNLEDCTGCYTYSYYYTYKVYTRGYTCSSGTLNGTSCVSTSTTSLSAYCSNGYYNGSSCVSSVYQYANPSYTCPAGYSTNYNTCTKNTTVYANPNYTCPAGYNLNGTNCIKSGTLTTNPNYSCPTGYNLNGTNCIKSGTLTTNPSYSCPSGYNLNGTKCSKVVRTYFCLSNEDTLNNSNHTCTRKSSGGYYSCPNGGTVDGKVCFVKSHLVTVAARYTTQVVSTSGTNVEYKWSDSKEEAGWEYTGKTRIVDNEEEITK